MHLHAIGGSETDAEYNDEWCTCIWQIIGGWLLGTTFALIYAIRAMTLHQYVILHALELDTRNDAHSEQV